MTHIFQAHHHRQFDSAPEVIFNSSTLYHDATYARSSMQTASNTTTSGLFKSFAAVPELYVKCMSAFSNINYPFGERDLLNIRSATGDILRFRMFAAGDVRAQVWNGSTYVTIGSSFGLSLGVKPFAVHVKTAVAGRVRFWYDGVLLVDYSGDTSALGNANRVELRNCFSAGAYWSEVMFATHNIVSARLRHHTLSAGSVAEWAGSVADINAADVSDGSFILSDTAAQVSTFAVDALPTDSLVVSAVSIASRARKNSSGPTGINAVSRIAAANYTETVGALTDGFVSRNTILTVNPATSAPWEKAEVTAAEFGVQSVA